MSTRDLTFYADPSHGWLEVPVTDVLFLGVAPSQYSYTKGDMVYLEEDCDINPFLNAADDHGWTINITHNHTNTDSVIRSYTSWRD